MWSGRSEVVLNIVVHLIVVDVKLLCIVIRLRQADVQW